MIRLLVIILCLLLFGLLSAYFGYSFNSNKTKDKQDDEELENK